MPDMKQVYDMVTKQKPPEPGALDRQHTRQRRRSMGKKVGAFAVAAAIGLAAVALFLGTRSGGIADTPADDPTAVNPVDGTAQVVARSFVEAFGAFDVDRMTTLLAQDADISDLMTSVGAQGVEGTLEELQLLTSLLEAQGYEQTIRSCEDAGSSAVGTNLLRCPFDFHNLESYELGVGPFSGSYFDITVRDGQIVRASIYWEIEEFSPQMWEPFAAWVSTTYPEDAAVMYEDDLYEGAQLTEDSIRLWERRSREYVDAETSKMVTIAERFMEARNAYDAETAMSLLADGEVTSQLLHDNRMHPDMFGVQLNHDELALAFEAERLYGVRYESFGCRPGQFRLEAIPGGNGSSANVICTYSMDSRLRQLAGSPPVESAFGLRIHEGKIDVLTFPWLNISWNPSGYYPAEFQRFVLWLDAEHPEAIDTENPGTAQRLFRVAGQEWILKLDRESLDLLAGYLDEYERSVNG
jgi:hypothetical protein